MLGTPVPEAAIDKHGHALAWKDQVGLATETGDRAAMLEEAEARAVKGGPQRNLWRSIPWTV